MAARNRDPTRNWSSRFEEGIGDLEEFQEWNLCLADFPQYASFLPDSKGLDLVRVCRRVHCPGQRKVRNWKTGHNLEMRLLKQCDESDDIFFVEMFLKNKMQVWLLSLQMMTEKGRLQPVLPLLFVVLMVMREK